MEDTVMLQKSVAAFACFAAVAALAGCGSSTTEAKGNLSWDDGSPISGASLTFVPKEPTAPTPGGFTDAKGDFSLTTGNKQGAAPGTYTVVVTKQAAAQVGGDPPQAPDKMSPQDMAKMMAEFSKKGKQGPPKNELPPVYADVKTTPLKDITVESGKRIELKLKKS
jgi:hypothetical protein